MPFTNKINDESHDFLKTCTLDKLEKVREILSLYKKELSEELLSMKNKVSHPKKKQRLV